MYTGTHGRARAFAVFIALVMVAPIALAAMKGDPAKSVVAGEAREIRDSVVKHYKLVAKDGGPNGYNHTQECFDDESGVDEFLLICMGQGYEKAKFTIPPAPQMPRLFEMAKEQITAGVLSGEKEIEEGATRIVVTWHATDSQNVTIDETHYIARK